MIVVEPVAVNDSNFTSSTIAEPDISQGEVEWIDPNDAIEFGSYTANYHTATLANDGNIYCMASFPSGVVLKVNVDTQSVSTFGSYSDKYNASALAGDGNIYCVGQAGDVLKINVDTQSVSTFSFTATNDIYTTATLATDGNIYCFGFNADAVGDRPLIVLKIDIEDQSAAKIYTSPILTPTSVNGAALGNDGHIYGVGSFGAVADLNISTQSVSTFGSYLGSYSDSILANDGFIYCVGNADKVLKIDTQNQITSAFGSYNKTNSSSVIYKTMSLIGDSSIFCLGIHGDVLVIDTDSQSLSKFGSSFPSVHASAVAFDDNIYGVGFGGVVAKVTDGYKSSDKVSLSSAHKTYQSVKDWNRDNPQEGAAKEVPTWVKVGPTNKYAPFDGAIRTQSIANNSIIEEITPGHIIGGLAVINMTGVSSVQIEMTDPIDGVVYDRTVTTENNSEINNWFNYLWTGFDFKTEFIVLDLPPYINATTKITLTGSGEIGVGAIVLGPIYRLGITNHGTNVRQLDFNIYNEDQFGNLDITPRPHAKLVNFKNTVDRGLLPYVYGKLEQLRGVNAVWVGDETDENDLTLVYGPHRDNTLNIDSPTACTVPIQIRGLT